MAVRMRPRQPIELVQGLKLPVDQAPTSHIIKPQPAFARQFPRVAANEFFCMKYESAGGAKIALMFSLAARFASSRAMAIHTLLRQRILDYLVGNADAHWKNHSLLWNRGRWEVAPGYDIVSTHAYPGLDARPALSIGGCMDDAAITAPHGARIQALTLALKALAESAHRESSHLYDDTAAGIGESNAAFLRDKVLPLVQARAARCLEIVEIAAELAPGPKPARSGSAA